MKKALRIKFAVCVIITLGSLLLLAPTIWSLANPDRLDKIPSWMPPTAMKLGLDLQGGVHMVMGVDIDGVIVSQLTTYGHSVERALAKKDLKGITSSVNAQDQELELKVPADVANDKVAAELAAQFNILEVVREDGKTFRLRLNNEQADYVRTHALDQSIETIRNRIDEFGVAEPVITRKGDSQVLVQFPGAQEPERLKALIGETAKLNFHIVPDCTQRDADCVGKMHADLQTKISDAEKKGNYTRDTFKRLSEYSDRINADLKPGLAADAFVAFEKVNDPTVVGKVHLLPWLLSSKNQLSGEYIENAYVTMSQGGGRRGGFGPERPEVAFAMNAAGSPLLGNLTSEFQGHYMAIVLDNIVKSAPVIQSSISDSGVITLGNGDAESMQREARDLSIVLRAGALPAKIETLEERVIGPSMGRDAIDAGKNALLISSLLIFLFTWAYYGKAGLLADLVIAVNVALIFGLLGAVGATLTLPGIAGIVLTIGMAVDALIIIYERMREEMRAGRSKRQTVELGFGRAFATILDSNVTTAIGAFVLLEYGTGSIRGFALTLLVGIIVNVFVSTFFCKVLFDVVFTDSKARFLPIGMSRKELSALSSEV